MASSERSTSDAFAGVAGLRERDEPDFDFDAGRFEEARDVGFFLAPDVAELRLVAVTVGKRYQRAPSAPGRVRSAA
jgi:hypothetical protein